mgnify:CR=1 FL=1
MSVMKRVRDLTVAAFNDMLEKSEDPVRLIDQYIQDRKQKIQEVEDLVRKCKEHNDSVKYQYLNALQMAEKREQQAAVALKAEEEELARMALQEKIMYEEKAAQYKQLLEEGSHTLEQASLQLSEWQDELREVLEKRHYYASRLESIQLQQQFSQHLGRVTDGKRAVRRLEDRMAEMEWEIKAQQSIWSMNDAWTTSSKRDWPDIDRDLAMLKEKLGKKGE